MKARARAKVVNVDTHQQVELESSAWSHADIRHSTGKPWENVYLTLKRTGIEISFCFESFAEARAFPARLAEMIEQAIKADGERRAAAAAKAGGM